MGQHERVNMAKSIEIVARGVCVQAGKVLVCRSVKHGHHYLPGGHVEWGETSPEALRREWLEELKVPCEVGDFLGVLEQTYGLAGERVAEISLVFRVDCPALSASRADTAEPDNIDFAWVPVGQLDSVRLLPAAIRKAIPAWVASPGHAAAYLQGQGEEV